MPIEDHLQILIPAAADVGYGNITIREYPCTVYARTEHHFIAVSILHIHYSPEWAKVQVIVYESSSEVQRYAGSNGIFPFELEASRMEQKQFGLINLSVDTDVRFTVHFRGWQIGEG